MKYFLSIFAAIFFLFVFSSLVNAENELSGYKIGQADVLLIDVINEPGLKTTAVVSADGTISFPYLGTIYVENMNLSEIKKKLEDGLKKGYINYPVVSVSLISSRSKKIFVIGEVRGPGGFDYEDKMTVIKAISRAGGLSENGKYGKVTVKRKISDDEYKNLPIDLKGVTEGYMTGDMLLQPNDLVIVERNSVYFMTGAVVKPGKYVLTSDMTVRNALSVAGGVRSDSNFGKITMRRKLGDNTYKDIEVDLNGLSEGVMTGNMLLQPNDSLIVERNNTYFVSGEVIKPGQYVLQDDTTLRNAISIAGGIDRNGLYGKITVRRKLDNNGYKDIEVDLNGISEGDMMLQPNDSVIVEPNNTYFVNGEFSKPGEYVLKDGLTVFKAITIAGGFTKWGSPNRVMILRSYGNENGYNTINVNIKAVIKGDASEDIILLPDDIVVASPGLY